MFVRMLRLPEETRRRYDLSSLRRVVHAAAPCPPEIKRQMIEWWGPIVDEYYGSSEGAGISFIRAEEWLERPGSVGKPMLGTPHILDERGSELPVGEVGEIYYEGGYPSITSTTKPRPRLRVVPRAGSPSAMSATSTMTAICISPTAATT